VISATQADFDPHGAPAAPQRCPSPRIICASGRWRSGRERDGLSGRETHQRTQIVWWVSRTTKSPDLDRSPIIRAVSLI